MGHSHPNPTPAYFLSYTIGHGSHNYERQRSRLGLEYWPSQSECETLVVEQWYKKKRDRARALRELREDGFFRLPCKQRVIRDIECVPNYEVLVHDMLDVIELAMYHEPCECRDGESLCLRCGAFHAYHHVTGHGL